MKNAILWSFRQLSGVCFVETHVFGVSLIESVDFPAFFSYDEHRTPNGFPHKAHTHKA